MFGAKLRIIIFIAKIFLNKFNNCFLSTGKPRVTLIIHNSEGGGNITDCNVLLRPLRSVRPDRGVYPPFKAVSGGIGVVEKTETGRLSAIREKS